MTQNQAHSWVEVWFPSYGWVSFDPTPAGTAGAVASTAWFWPGRFLFDAVQHRWNKWVLDYSVESQWGLLDRLRTWSEEERAAPLRSPGTGGGWLGCWLRWSSPRWVPSWGADGSGLATPMRHAHICGWWSSVAAQASLAPLRSAHSNWSRS